MEESSFLLKVNLLHIEPEIYRRVSVPQDITLDRLHDVIQIIMGWSDCHRHQFTIKGQNYTEYPESEDMGIDSGKYRLSSLIRHKGLTFTYLYDFSDRWEHEITIEDNKYTNADLLLPVECIEGKRACPPEDIGGLEAYRIFIDALKDPRHESHEFWRQWICSQPWYAQPYNPEFFDVHFVNCELLKFINWSRDRYQLWDDYL